MFLVCQESTIQEFLTFYRSNFPAAKITTKRHLLEDHVCEFLRTWRVGFGMMGGAGGRVNTCGIQQPEEDICQCPQQRDTVKTSNSGAPQKGVPPTAAENHNPKHDPRGGVKTASYLVYLLQ